MFGVEEWIALWPPRSLSLPPVKPVVSIPAAFGGAPVTLRSGPASVPDRNQPVPLAPGLLAQMGCASARLTRGCGSRGFKRRLPGLPSSKRRARGRSTHSYKRFLPRWHIRTIRPLRRAPVRRTDGSSMYRFVVLAAVIACEPPTQEKGRRSEEQRGRISYRLKSQACVTWVKEHFVLQFGNGSGVACFAPQRRSGTMFRRA